MRIYEINTRVECGHFNDVAAHQLHQLAKLGFDAIWMMGVWEISEGAKRISKIHAPDFEGSPYAVPRYRFNPALGGKAAFSALVKRARSSGLRVVVDFVPNHMALDSPLIQEDPSYFIRSDTSARDQMTSEFFLHRSSEVIAFGRDPYFPPWNDTAQLDYTNPILRSRMIELLKWIARHADGVRCDMAMLVMRDHIRRQWYPKASTEWFDSRMPTEFWGEAIAEVKRGNPDFVFIAESYWDKEQQLIALGFDLAYEKHLYDALVSRNPAWVVDRLSRPLEALRSSLHFIENHDEPRAASVFEPSANLAAAALLLAAPGSVLIHSGQLEGRRERLPVQRIKRLHEEPLDSGLRSCYERLLTVTSAPIFTEGSFRLFGTGVQGIVSFIRTDPQRLVAYLGQIADIAGPYSELTLDISQLASAFGSPSRLRVTSLLTEQSAEINGNGGYFHLKPGPLLESSNARYCLLEVSPQ